MDLGNSELYFIFTDQQKSRDSLAQEKDLFYFYSTPCRFHKREKFVKVLFMYFSQYYLWLFPCHRKIKQSQEVSSADGSFDGIHFFDQKLIRFQNSNIIFEGYLYMRLIRSNIE